MFLVFDHANHQLYVAAYIWKALVSHHYILYQIMLWDLRMEGQEMVDRVQMENNRYTGGRREKGEGY